MLIEEKCVRINALGLPDRAHLNASVVDGLDMPQMRFQAMHSI